MNILLYARVSTDEQVLDPQWIELREWARRTGATVLAEYSDVLSGAKAARPGLDALVERCRQGGVAAVVVVKLDRLGRPVINVCTLVQTLRAAGTGVICTSQGIDTRDENPCGKMVMGIMAAFAEFERDLIRERTRAGLRAARSRGALLGRPSAVAVPPEARPAIIAGWVAEGAQGIRELARRLGGVSTATAAKWYADWQRKARVTIPAQTM